ncbi:MAG: DUF262 domain-containing protein [Elusimicrobia bacterium]|nr:DUF262 domain-containing protein [Candidatus Liberimonas magnetica]
METNLEKEYKRVKKNEGEDSYAPPIHISKIINEIEEGNWVIPEFQRDFVWGADKFTLLFDSIYRGYTIGNLLLWKTDEKLAHRRVGEKETIPLEDVRSSGYTYILDGQQRVTTLYGVLKGKPLYRFGKKNAKLYKIYFDIENDEFVTENQKLKEFQDKSIRKLISEDNFDKFRFIDMSHLYNEDLNFPKNLIDKEREKIDNEFDKEMISKTEYQRRREYLKSKEKPLENFKEIIKSYKIHQILTSEDLDKVVTVFERINTQNVKLDIFDIMVAKTYENVLFNDKTYTFNLGKAILKVKYKNELNPLKLSPEETLPDDENLYYNIDSTTLLRIISVFINSDNKVGLQKEDIYKLKAQSIQDKLLGVRSVLENINNYFKNQVNLNAIDVDFTDNKILSFLAYIFSKEKYSKADLDVLNKWFWNTMVFNRFPGAQLQRIEADLKEYSSGKDKFLQHIKRDRNLSILNEDLQIDKSKLIDTGYDNQNYLYKSVILLLNSLKPKDFNGKTEINLVEYIGTSTKNNKHHIIPYNSKLAKVIREKYKNDKVANAIINNIANICIISSEINQEIKKKDPKEYFKLYENIPDFKSILKDHLIDEEMYNDLKNDRFEPFLIKRTQKILNLINKNCCINEEVIVFDETEERENA